MQGRALYSAPDALKAESSSVTGEAFAKRGQPMIGSTYRFLAGLFASLAFVVFAGPIMVPPAATSTVSVTNSSAASALVTNGAGEIRNVELSNAGAQTVFVEFCPSSTCTATVAAGYPILANQTKVVTIKGGITHIAALTSSSTSTLYVTVGVGE